MQILKICIIGHLIGSRSCSMKLQSKYIFSNNDSEKNATCLGDYAHLVTKAIKQQFSPILLKLD